MSKYQEFITSLGVGKAKAEEDRLAREDEDRNLPLVVGDFVRRMCDYFQCSADQVRYIDTRSNIPTGSLQEGVPLLRYAPERGRYCVDLEIGIGDQGKNELYPVWLHLECVPLKHGGMEVHFGPSFFQLPDEEKGLFDNIADAINEELRERYGPPPRKLGG
jgi:hypothetical protein